MAFNAHVQEAELAMSWTVRHALATQREGASICDAVRRKIAHFENSLVAEVITRQSLAVGAETTGTGNGVVVAKEFWRVGSAILASEVFRIHLVFAIKNNNLQEQTNTQRRRGDGHLYDNRLLFVAGAMKPPLRALAPDAAVDDDDDDACLFLMSDRTSTLVPSVVTTPSGGGAVLCVHTYVAALLVVEIVSAGAP